MWSASKVLLQRKIVLGSFGRAHLRCVPRVTGTPIDALLQTQLVLGSFGRAGVGGEIAARCGKGDRGREVSIWLKASMRVKG